MIVFVCVDDRDGMMFNGRRLSQDRKLREAVLETASPGRLWMNEYSRGQFPQEASICVSRDFLSLAQEKDFCFVCEILKTAARFKKIYPAAHKKRRSFSL